MSDYPKPLYTTENRQVVALSQDFDPRCMIHTHAEITTDTVKLIRYTQGGTAREFELSAEEMVALCNAWTDFCYEQNKLTEEEEQEVLAVQEAYSLVHRVPGLLIGFENGRYSLYKDGQAHINGLNGDELLGAIQAIATPVEVAV